MNSLATVLDSFLQKEGKGLQNAMKKSTLFKFWDKVVGKKFENSSKPISLATKVDKTVLTVACESASVTSELMLYKKQLIEKFNVFANPLGFEIDDMIFSHKIWQHSNHSNQKSFENNVVLQEENPYKEDLSGFDPDEITLDDDEVNSIKNNISKNKALSKEQQERLFNSIVYDLKVQKFKNL